MCDIDYDIMTMIHSSYHTYHIIYDIDYDMTYDIIGKCSIRPAAAFSRPRCGCGLTVTLPRICRPDPALAEPLCPDSLGLGDRHHPGAPPAVAPHPDVHLVEPAVVAPVPLRVGGGLSTTPIVLEAVWDSGGLLPSMKHGMSTLATGQM
jgi:hypothetical protein